MNWKFIVNNLCLLLAQYTKEKGIDLGGLFDNLKVNVDSYKEIINEFNNIESFDDFLDLETNKVDWDNLSKSIGITDTRLRSYFETLDDGNGTINNQSASIEGLSAHLKATGQSFDFAAIKTTLFNTALNAGIFLVASLAIQGIAKVLDNYIHRADNARERTDELFTEFKQMNDTLADHRKTVAELADRYTELSKGVNLSDNKNISLSTDEYEEFLHINEQLADAFPELANGIDQNGNAILTLGTKGITAKEQLEELLQTEEDLNNFRTAQGLDDAFKGVYTYVEDANEAAEKLNGTISDSSEAMGRLQDIAENGITLTGGNGQLIFGGNVHNEAELNYMNALTDSANEFWKALDGSRRVELSGFGIDNSTLFKNNLDSDTDVFEIYADTYWLTPEEITELEALIQDNVGDAAGALLDSIGDQSQKLQEQIQKGRNAWADFIPNLVSGMKSKQTFKNLDSDLQDIAVQIVEGLDYSYADKMNEWDPDPYAYVRDKIIDPLNKLDDAGKQKLASDFEKLFQLDALDISDDNREEINHLITSIAELLETDPVELRVALGFDVGDDARKRLQNSIRQITDDHGISDREQYSALTEYTRNFTAAQAELWLEAASGARNAAEAIALYETKIAEESNRPSDQISKMSAALTAKKEHGFADTDTLSGFDAEVHGLDSWDRFQETLGSTVSSYKECREAAAALAAEWVNSSDFLNQLTEENREYYETQLEAMNVQNYEELIESILEAKEALSDVNLSELTAEDIESLIAEGDYAALTAGQIWSLYYAKLAETGTFLDTSADCQSMLALADDAMLTAEAIRLVSELMSVYGGLENGAYDGNRTARMDAMEAAESIQSKLESLAKGEGDGLIKKPERKIGGNNGRKSGGGSGSKEKTENDTTKEYNWIEQAIENVEKEIRILDETASSSYSTLSQKNEALTNEIGKVTEEIELQQKAYEEYMRKADSIGLPDSYKELVQNGAAGIEDIKDEKLQEQIDGYQKWYEKAQNASDAIRELNTSLKDLRVESYKLQTETLKDRLDSESITEKQYLAELKAAYEQFYGNLSEYAEQYHEAKLEYLKEEKKYLNSVANAAASVLDTEIDRIREDAEKQEELLKTQAELLEARKKPLQEELEALDEKTRKEELAFHLQKAQYDLARAENQQTKLVYTADKGMIYTSDSTAIRDARKGLDDAKSEIHKQSIQDQIDALDDEISRYDDLIDQINKAADAQVKALEQFKSKWQEVIDVQEQAKNITILTGEFGADAVAKILSGKDGDLLAQWKDSYLDTLKSIDLESQGYIGEMTKQVESFYQHSIKALSDAAGKAADAADAAAARNNLNLLDHPITLENGTVLTPLQPGDRGYDLLLKTKPLTDKIMRGEMDIFSNAVFEGQRQMEQWAKTINYSNIINHVANNVTNNRNMQPVVHQEIHVTLPNVNNYTAAETLLRDLQSLSTKKYQVDW